MQIVLAVFLTLVWPCLFDVTRRFWAWFRQFCSWFRKQLNADGRPLQPPAEAAPLLDADPTWTYNHADSTRWTLLGFLKTILRFFKGETKLTPGQWTTMVVIATMLFMAFVAHTVAGVFSAKVATDRAALSSSKHCGIWMFDDDAGYEAAGRDDLRDYVKEDRAGQYAQNCYNTPSSGYANGCDYFYNQSIPYSVKFEQPCPFKSANLCLHGLYSAVTFDTGFVDASVIGINSPTSYKFRRQSTCSPLNTSEPYIRQVPGKSNETTYRYYYGPKDNVDYTFETSGTPFQWLVPVYSVE